jgi:hypothetical protein
MNLKAVTFFAFIATLIYLGAQLCWLGYLVVEHPGWIGVWGWISNLSCCLFLAAVALFLKALHARQN